MSRHVVPGSRVRRPEGTRSKAGRRTVVPAVCLRQLNVTEDGQDRSVSCRSATGSRVPGHADTCMSALSRHNLNVTRCGTLNQWSVSYMAHDTGDYARTVSVWPRMTTCGKVTRMRWGYFYWVSHANLSGGAPASPNFWDPLPTAIRFDLQRPHMMEQRVSRG